MKKSLSFQNIVENLSVSIVLVDEHYRIVYLNSAAEVLFDLSQRQAEAIPFNTILASEEQLFVGLDRVKESKQALIEREIKLYIPAHGEFLVDCTIKPIEGDNGSSLLLLEFFQLDSQHRISRDESLQVQHQVVRGLAHEIKNPLGGLRGAAQLLERQLESDELKEYTQIIINEADRLQNLLSSMLGPYQQAKKDWINIHAVLQRVRHLVQSEVDQRLSFIADYDPSLPEIWADMDQLVQIFLNIVRNAVQVMNGCGKIILRTRIQRNITIENKFHRLVMEVQIEDNGPGVPENMQETMFYPLVTGRAEGTGLGLYLSQNLIHRNNGMISCSSREGSTIFSIMFPLERVSDK